MKSAKKISIVFVLLVMCFGFFSQPAVAAKKKIVTQTNSGDAYFHKRKLVHKKAPIPEDPKPTRIEIKKAKQQAIAGKGYIKTLKSWLSKKQVAKKKPLKKTTK